MGSCIGIREMPNCICPETYYDDSNECIKCPFQCGNCANAATCESCSGNRV